MSASSSWARPTSNDSSSASTALRFATAAFALVTTANAAVYNVAPDGNPMTLTAALEVAGAGDTISLGDGIYREPIVTMNAGEDGNPLVIEGGKGAVINYFSGDRSLMWSQKVVDIRHSWITLRGFTVDGHLDDNDVEESYVDKCIWVEGQDKPTMVPYQGSEVETSLIGTVIDDMKIQNCGMECIRMRNWVTNSVIMNNDIEDCGIYDFRFQFDGKIGEAVYIGTSSNQWTDGPDGCNYNLVKNNKIVPRGNECVDIKEGATLNVVEYNDCAEQLDAESGCYDSRGNENIFRHNKADQCLGAGVRLGGHVIDGFVYGVDNHVFNNEFSGTGVSSIKAMQHPQGIICGNSCDESSGECEVKEKGEDDEIDASWDQSCPTNLPVVPFIDDLGPTPTPGPIEQPPTDTDAYEALGCYTDTPTRIMSSQLTDPDLTTESCALECEGYKFFGTQYGIECWCGGDDTDYAQHGVSGACGFDCAGDSSQTCGGSWAMNVYEYSSSPTPSTPTPAPIPTGTDEYETLGCYTDTSTRIMSYKLTDPDLTTESCALECEGYAFFGTQYGIECWCGGEDTDYAQHGVSENCDFDCAGDSSQTCGGGWAMNVYQYTTSTTACDGVLSNQGQYCCASSCGTCGGSGCSSRDGGALSCCTSKISQSGVTCEDTGGAAPCIVSGSA